MMLEQDTSSQNRTEVLAISQTTSRSSVNTRDNRLGRVRSEVQDEAALAKRFEHDDDCSRTSKSVRMDRSISDRHSRFRSQGMEATRKQEQEKKNRS